MSKPELLIVSPLPPARSGIATYTHDLLLGGLADDWSVTMMLRDGEQAPTDASFPVIHASSHRWFVATAKPHQILHCLGNSEFHTHVPGLITRYGGVVLAHDVRMNGLHRMRAEANSQLSVSSLVRHRHGDLLADEIDEIERRRDYEAIHTRLDAANAYMFEAAVSGANAVAVHSGFAKRLADLELGGAIGVTVVPFGHRSSISPRNLRTSGERTVHLATFGMVAPQKKAGLLVDAVAKVAADGCDITLRFVGEVSDGYRDDLLQRASELGIAHRVSFSGHIHNDDYLRELQQADAAIQLRAASNGEASAAIADCMSAGLPTIVTNIGGQVELPDDCVRKVPGDADATTIAAAIAGLAVDASGRDALGRQGQRFAAAHSFRNAADALTQLLHATTLHATGSE